jgi:hypothetical protein
MSRHADVIEDAGVAVIMMSKTSPNKLRLRCMRTTHRASSGENIPHRRMGARQHIDIRKHFPHEVIQNGDMKLVRVLTSSQLADILTKPLHFLQWQACVAGIVNKTHTST